MDPLSPETRASSGAPDEALNQFVVFKLGGNEFAVAIEQVQEILVLGPVARVPKTPGFIEGIINVRGKIIPVLNLRKRLEIAGAARDQDARIIVAEVDEQTVGMIVDLVTEVVKLPVSGLEPPPPLITTVSPRFVTSVGKLDGRILVILNLDRILSPEEMSELSATTGARAGRHESATAPTPSA